MSLPPISKAPSKAERVAELERYVRSAFPAVADHASFDESAFIFLGPRKPTKLVVGDQEFLVFEACVRSDRR